MTSDGVQADAALNEARECLSRGDLEGARAAADRLALLLDGVDAPDELRARTILVRASADELGGPDPVNLAWAGDLFAGAGLWEEAMNAYFLLAREAGSRRSATDERRWLAHALGAAEAGGSRVYAPNLLRRIALVELREGNARRAGDLATIARDRLRGVPSLNARLSEAECLETMGDAWDAAGDRGQAISCWRDAMERQESLERRGAAEALREKIGSGHR